MQPLNALLRKLNLFDEQKGYQSIALIQDFDTTFSFDIAEKLKETIKPDAVYHFNNQPFILFFDFSSDKQDARIKEFHSKVWCFDKAPIVFAIYDTNIEIYNAFKYGQDKKLKQIILNDKTISDKFSYWELQSGNTWAWLLENYKNDFEKKNRVNQKLFESIKALRAKLTDDNNIQPILEKDANVLVLRLIFSRYLVDRGVDIDNFIDGNSLEQKKQNFNELIANKNQLTNFFAHLKERFNGNLFEKPIELHNDNLRLISNIFKGDFATKQLSLFDVYDFNIIPVETISGIYESIIDEKKQKENSAIYTPSFLVDYILNETVEKELKGNTKTCITLDPACGSGIFLVQTFRKIAFHRKQQNGNLAPNDLCEIVKNNLYGIDRDINALNVAIFSLYVAILDFIKPIEITNIQLPKLLGENLFRNDFFNVEDTFFDEEPEFHKYNERFRDIQFDFILGNPPWGSKNNSNYDRFHLDYLKKNKNIVSNFEISQSFILRTREFCTPNTSCALIVISSAFHSLWAKNFSKYFFSNYKVNSIFDMSPVRHFVFNADAPAIIAFYQYNKNDNTINNVLTHISLKYNYYLDNFKKLVIDSNEIKRVKQRKFIQNHSKLKTYLYGSNSDEFFINRLNSINFSIAQHIEQSSNTIFVGGGIQKNQSKRSKNYVSFLEGLPAIENKEVMPLYTALNDKKIFTKDDCIISNGRIKELFYGSRILLKARPKNETYIIASYIENNSVFNEKIFAISSITQKEDLKYFWAILNSNLFSYYQFLSSISWGIFMPEINQQEYLSFPYLEPKDKQELISLVDEFLNTCRENEVDIEKQSKLLNSINKTINETYGVDEVEKDLIDYGLNISRYEFQKGKQHFINRQVQQTDLEDYAKLFLDHFSNYYYEEEGEYFNIEIHFSAYCTAMKFNISEVSVSNKISFIHSSDALYGVLFNNLSISEVSSDIFIQKCIKGFEEDGFYIIKPNQYKYWHRATAHNDISEFMNAMLKSDLKKQIEIIA